MERMLPGTIARAIGIMEDGRPAGGTGHSLMRLPPGAPGIHTIPFTLPENLALLCARGVKDVLRSPADPEVTGRVQDEYVSAMAQWLALDMFGYKPRTGPVYATAELAARMHQAWVATASGDVRELTPGALKQLRKAGPTHSMPILVEHPTEGDVALRCGVVRFIDTPLEMTTRLPEIPVLRIHGMYWMAARVPSSRASLLLHESELKLGYMGRPELHGDDMILKIIILLDSEDRRRIIAPELVWTTRMSAFDLDIADEDVPNRSRFMWRVLEVVYSTPVERFIPVKDNPDKREQRRRGVAWNVRRLELAEDPYMPPTQRRFVREESVEPQPEPTPLPEDAGDPDPVRDHKTRGPLTFQVRVRQHDRLYWVFEKRATTEEVQKAVQEGRVRVGARGDTLYGVYRTIHSHIKGPEGAPFYVKEKITRVVGSDDI